MTRRPDAGNEDLRVASQIELWRAEQGAVTLPTDPWGETDARITANKAAQTALLDELDRHNKECGTIPQVPVQIKTNGGIGV